MLDSGEGNAKVNPSSLLERQVSYILCHLCKQGLRSPLRPTPACNIIIFSLYLYLQAKLDIG